MPHDPIALFSSMQFERSILQEIIVEANPDYDVTSNASSDFTIGFDFDVTKHATRMAFRVMLSVDITPRREDSVFPFQHIRIVLEGYFRFPEETSEEFVYKVTPYNQLAILYGVARGIVSTVTGSTEAGVFLLPTVDFDQVIEDRLRDLDAAAQPEDAALPAPARKRATRKKPAASREGGGSGKQTAASIRAAGTRDSKKE